MEPSFPLGTTRLVPQEKLPQKPYNKSFIDQACSVKMAGYWPRYFFCVFMDRDGVKVHKHAKKELGHYPAILTEQAWSITHTSCAVIGYLSGQDGTRLRESHKINFPEAEPI